MWTVLRFSTNGVAGVLEKLGRDAEAVFKMEEAYTLSLQVGRRAYHNLGGVLGRVESRSSRVP